MTLPILEPTLCGMGHIAHQGVQWELGQLAVAREREQKFGDITPEPSVTDVAAAQIKSAVAAVEKAGNSC